jgi:hypothetical protein
MINKLPTFGVQYKRQLSKILLSYGDHLMNQNAVKVLPIKQVQIIIEVVEEEGVVEVASNNLLVELALNVAKTVT